MDRPVTLIEPNVVKLDRVLPGPIARVWSYITESDKRAQWLAAGEFDLRIGGAIRLEFDNDSLSGEKGNAAQRREDLMSFDGHVTRLDPYRLLAHTWNWDGASTEVTYELTPYGKGTRLVITHRNLQGRDLQADVMGGWDAHTGILEDLLNGEQPRPFWKTQRKLAREYAAAI
ncbi:MAG TPA: SRPBCC family protein [Usitatibacter sp.]|nr:SRPBCC family protein [Usitatibacter sp.]